MIFQKSILLLFALTIACGTNKQNISNSQSVDAGECKTLVTVRDFTGLDGCRFLLELENGDRLLPVEVSNPDFLYSEGQKLKINYRIMKGLVTACMTGASTVAVDCIMELKAGENEGRLLVERRCDDTDAPLSVSWISKLVSRNKVTEIMRGYQESKPVYVLLGSLNTMLFDCTGSLICEYPNNQKTKCSERIALLSMLKSEWAQK